MMGLSDVKNVLRQA